MEGSPNTINLDEDQDEKVYSKSNRSMKMVQGSNPRPQFMPPSFNNTINHSKDRDQIGYKSTNDLDDNQIYHQQQSEKEPTSNNNFRNRSQKSQIDTDYYKRSKNQTSNPFSRQPSQVQEKQEIKQKRTRVRRYNIPTATLIDRKTGQVIRTVNRQKINFANIHPEDKDTIQEINRMLIQNQFCYSNLLGRQNNVPEAEIEDFNAKKAPRDGQFPEILTIISPNMRNSFKRNGEDFLHLIQSTHKIKMVQDAMSFGLEATNSRYFLFGLFSLTNNLKPSLLAVGLATDKAAEQRRQGIYYEILKCFIENNNAQMTEKKNEFFRQQSLKRRSKRDPEQIIDINFEFPKILFAYQTKDMINATQRIKRQYSLTFDLVPSFSFRQKLMNQRFLRHQLKKERQILSKGQRFVKRMLQTNNPKEIQSIINELNKHNQDFGRRFRKFQLSKYCNYHFPKKYVGFHVFDRFQRKLIQYLNELVTKNGGVLKHLISNILSKQEQQKKQFRVAYKDISHQLQYNARLRRLKPLIEPLVLSEIIEVFKMCSSLKLVKQETQRRYTVGSDKRCKKVTVQFRNDKWRCECGYFEKIGIPCSHLMKVLHTEKFSKYEDYINSNYFRTNQFTVVQLDNPDIDLNSLQENQLPHQDQLEHMQSQLQNTFHHGEDIDLMQ